MFDPKKKKRVVERDILKPMPGWDDRPVVDAVVVSLDTHNINVYDPLHVGDVHTLYRCVYPLNGARIKGVLKIANQKKDDDLTIAECETLKHLRQQFMANGATSGNERIPAEPLRGHAEWKDDVRAVSVFRYSEDLFSLAEIKQAHPDGLALQDAAWMMNRILEALTYVHKGGRIHGAILPHNVLVSTGHKGILADFSFAVPMNKRLQAYLPTYAEWYPPEVFDKRNARPGTDVYMAALCLLYLIGGDPIKRTAPKDMPPRVGDFFKKCLRSNPQTRVDNQETGSVRDEFGAVLRLLYGEPKFRKFEMPVRA